MNKTVTIAEIAKHFHVPMYKVWEWIRDGKLNATKVEDHHRLAAYRVDDAEFEAFKLRWSESESKNRHDTIPFTTSHEVKDMDKTMTPPQVAKYLRVRRDTVLAWIRSGELRAINISNAGRPSYRVDPADLEDFKLRRSSRAAIPTRLGRPPRQD